MAIISIHPPRVGWDSIGINQPPVINNFNPPTPCGVGLQAKKENIDWEGISIHPPRVGWDHGLVILADVSIDFNPPTPCGVGPGRPRTTGGATTFQSTHPVWGGTDVRLRKA